MDKVPFYSKDELENFSNNYHPEMFDLLNYYQDLQDTKDDKDLQSSEKDPNQIIESPENKHDDYHKSLYDPNYPEF